MSKRNKNLDQRKVLQISFKIPRDLKGQYMQLVLLFKLIRTLIQTVTVRSRKIQERAGISKAFIWSGREKCPAPPVAPVAKIW